jgi:bifunctional non-homologous end joining protein LigD
MQKELPVINPIQPIARAEPFDDAHWLFELKYDGFRAMAYILDGKIRLRSKTTAILQGFPTLRSALQYELRVHDTVIDGEIVSFDETNHVNFELLLKRRGRIGYFAFDLPLLNGEDLRARPLIERKELLRRILPDASDTLFYADHVLERGTALFALAEQNDLEGIIAKPNESPYDARTHWYKIRNSAYTQATDRPDVGEMRSRKRA